MTSPLLGSSFGCALCSGKHHFNWPSLGSQPVHQTPGLLGAALQCIHSLGALPRWCLFPCLQPFRSCYDFFNIKPENPYFSSRAYFRFYLLGATKFVPTLHYLCIRLYSSYKLKIKVETWQSSHDNCNSLGCPKKWKNVNSLNHYLHHKTIIIIIFPLIYNGYHILFMCTFQHVFIECLL